MVLILVDRVRLEHMCTIVLVIKFGEHGSTEVKAYGTQRIRKSSKEKNPERFVILVN